MLVTPSGTIILVRLLFLQNVSSSISLTSLSNTAKKYFSFSLYSLLTSLASPNLPSLNTIAQLSFVVYLIILVGGVEQAEKKNTIEINKKNNLLVFIVL